jgi:hypothetical protein
MATTRRKGGASRKARGKRRATPARGGASRVRELTLPELFQRYFDRQLRPPAPRGGAGRQGPVGGPGDLGFGFDPRQACCQRIHQLLAGGGPFGPGLENIANQHFGATAAQAAALRGWPDPQLWLFLQTLRLGLKCPNGPHDGPPELPGLPDPSPDPGPEPGPYRMRFRGRPSRGAKSLEIALSGRTVEITFVAPRIP